MPLIFVFSILSSDVDGEDVYFLMKADDMDVEDVTGEMCACEVQFDPLCETASRADFVRIYKDSSCTDIWGEDRLFCFSNNHICVLLNKTFPSPVSTLFSHIT